jgi:NADPH:quinone reductase-like Zn-dependent oxidoreductase
MNTMPTNKSFTVLKFQPIILSLLFFIFPLAMIAEGVEPQSGKGLTVFITGANRGLGLEFAKQFSAKGYKVIGTARKPEEATALKATGAQIVKHSHPIGMDNFSVAGGRSHLGSACEK